MQTHPEQPCTRSRPPAMRTAPTWLAASIAFVVCLAAACNPSGDGAPGWLDSSVDTIAATPDIGLHGDSSDVLFSSIARVTVGPDGRIYVVDRAEPEIMVFDSAGQLAGRIGRRGSGPGEFEGLSRFGFVGDTLWAQDWIRKRTTFFTVDGQYLRVADISLGADSSRSQLQELPIALLEGGSAVYERPSPATTLPPDAEVPLIFQRPDGALDTLGWRAAWRGSIPVAGLGALRVPRIQDYPLLSVDPRGRSIAYVIRSPDSTDKASSRVRVIVWNAKGTQRLDRLLGELPGRPVSARTRDSLYGEADAALERTMTALPELRERIADPEAAVRSALLVPDIYPPVTEARAMSGGTLWLRLATDSPDQEWLVLNADAKPLHVVRLPTRVRVEDATDGRVWVVSTDSLDVPSVSSYRYGEGSESR